jgi:hypothetical protein
MLTSGAPLGLEQCVDKGRDGGTLCEDKQSANQDERDDNRRQPILLVLSHELPEFAHDLCFRHLEFQNRLYRDVATLSTIVPVTNGHLPTM